MLYIAHIITSVRRSADLIFSQCRFMSTVHCHVLISGINNQTFLALFARSGCEWCLAVVPFRCNSRRQSQSCRFTQELAALTWNFSHMLTCDLRVFHVFFFPEPPPWDHAVFFPFDSHILSVLPESWYAPGDSFQRGALCWCLPRPHEEKCLNIPVPAPHTAHEFISFSIAAQ